jgi:hypothetical protein
MSLSPQALPSIATGLSAAGSYIGGQQSAQALRMQAIVAREQALADESALRRESRANRGENAAALAENGLSSSGSSASFLDQQAALAELDALNIRYKGDLRARGLKSQASAASTEGSMLAGTRLLTGASDEWARRRTEKY